MSVADWPVTAHVAKGATMLLQLDREEKRADWVDRASAARIRVHVRGYDAIVEGPRADMEWLGKSLAGEEHADWLTPRARRACGVVGRRILASVKDHDKFVAASSEPAR